ncbi:MAG: metal-dependent transcriptional regulator [Pirellulaceae bacterium]|nr:metal-dependent transcriptional regulator [Pirellulaceae bacterium]
MPSLTIENYVKTIYLISIAQQGQPVATGQLADALGVAPGTVTSMAKTLSESGLAIYKPYTGVLLTPSGHRLAMRIIRRHRLIETFLVQTLKLNWDEVHDEAENMEHAVSDLLVDRIDEFLGFPMADPHGDPIPAADGTIIHSEGVTLDQLPAGTRFRLVRVLDQSASFLQDLSRDGLSIDSEGMVREQGETIFVLINDREISLNGNVATKILVQVTTPRQPANAPGPA